jgi:signal transduction histidine kinase
VTSLASERAGHIGQAAEASGVGLVLSTDAAVRWEWLHEGVGTERGMFAAIMTWVRAHRPLADAVGYAVFSVFAAAIGLVGVWTTFSLLPFPVSPWWSLLFALPACALVLVRSLAPFPALFAGTVLCIADVLTVGGIGTFLVLLDLVFTATRTTSPRGRRRMLIGIGVAVVVVTAAAFATSRDFRVTLVIGLQFAALLGTVYWYATAVAQAHELVELHRQRALDAERLAERDRTEAVRREREDMARELHDLVAGHVSAMAIRAEAALSSPVSPTVAPLPEADRAALRAVRDSSLEAHSALRSMISVLRTGSDAPVAPLRRDALPVLADDARRHGLRVTLDDAIAGDIPAPVDHALARIVQESLANCLRHASGADVAIALDADETEVRARIDSRGGAPLERPALVGNGWGLELLAERARALGGGLEAGPTRDGWSVSAVLPRETPA